MSKAKYSQKLLESGLTPKDATKLKLKYLEKSQVSTLTDKQFNENSLLIPYFELNGKKNCFYRVRRLDSPRSFKKKIQRYTQPKDALPRVYFPPLLNISWTSVSSDTNIPVFITEGELKAAAGCKYLKEPVMALGGVWNWKSKKNKIPVIKDIEKFKWSSRTVYIVFDSDSATNPNVQHALNALAKTLTGYGAFINIITIPSDNPEIKLGLDDFLVTFGADAFEALIESAQPFSLSKVLWQLNSDVVLIKHPTMIIDRKSKRLMNEKSFKTVYGTYKFFKEKDDGKMVELGAAIEWLKWGSRLEVAELVYEPGCDEFVYNDNNELCYNSWSGWPYKPKPGNVKPWTDLMKFIFGKDKEAREWFEMWCAYQFQHPGVKLYTAVILWGTQTGTGKSLIGMTLGKLFGRNFIKISQNNLHGNYDGWKEDKQFVLGDEITGIEKRKEAENIKSIVTDEVAYINPKFMPQRDIKICFNSYFTSNHSDSFVIEDKDRRFFIWEAPHEMLPLPFAAKFDKWLKDDTCMENLFYYFLNKINTKKFEPHAPAYKTAARDDMINASKSDLGIWISELKKNASNILRLDNVALKSDLYTTNQLTELFLIEYPNSKWVTGNAIARELTKAGFPKPKVVGVNSPKTAALRPVRNFEKWAKAPAKIWTEHYMKAHNIESKNKTKKY